MLRAFFFHANTHCWTPLPVPPSSSITYMMISYSAVCIIFVLGSVVCLVTWFSLAKARKDETVPGNQRLGMVFHETTHDLSNVFRFTENGTIGSTRADIDCALDYAQGYRREFEEDTGILWDLSSFVFLPMDQGDTVALNHNKKQMHRLFRLILVARVVAWDRTQRN